MTPETLVGLAGIAGTLVAGVFAQWWQDRRDARAWLRHERYELYARIAQHALSGLDRERELAFTWDPYDREDTYIRGPRDVPDSEGLVFRTAQLQLLGDERTKAAWATFVQMSEDMDQQLHYAEDAIRKDDWADLVNAREEVIAAATAAMTDA